jgi:vacuolar protein sorting-associated protein 26
MNVQIKTMELCIVRKESFGNGEQVKHEIETLEKFEIMDGCPAKDEIIPIRLYLSGVDLTPSYKNINNRLQVKHFVNLVLIDQDDRKFFKQHDIEIYRRK